MWQDDLQRGDQDGQPRQEEGDAHGAAERRPADASSMEGQDKWNCGR